MFEDQDFTVFDATTLEDRMTRIRTELDPKFEEFAALALPQLNQNASGSIWYAHVAKHLRRTVYPPENTWVAFAPNKRGYKMMPHFELGFWNDRLYLYLCFLENLKTNATKQHDWTLILQQALPQFSQLPADTVISPNHMERAVLAATPENLEQTIEAFGTKKHTEFSIGVNVKRGDPRFGTTELTQNLLERLAQLQTIEQTLSK